MQHARRSVRVGGVLAPAALLVLAATAMAEGPFHDLDFTQASAKAEKEHKLVFIDFFTTWCGPCKMLDQTTWKDEKVVTFLTEKTVAIKLDAEKEKKLAAKYKIQAYPSLLFLKPDGKESDRIIGYREPAEFLEEGNGILSGKDPITRAREKLEKAGKDNPMARVAFARTLQEKGKPEEALKEYLWCFDEGATHDPSFVGVRLSFLLSDIAQMGQDYPPALAALRQRRDNARKDILADKEVSSRAMDFAAINSALEKAADTLALYDQLKKEKPKSEALPVLRDQVTEQLLEKHRYAEIAESGDMNKRLDQEFSRWKEAVDEPAPAQLNEDQKKQMAQMRDGYFAGRIGHYYQVLVGLKRTADAEKLAQRMLKLAPTSNTYNELAWNGFLTGAPTETNLEQARKGVELSNGKEAAVIDTLARILNARKKRDEAVAFLEKAIKEIENERDQAVLKQCLDDVKSGKTAAPK